MASRPMPTRANSCTMALRLGRVCRLNARKDTTGSTQQRGASMSSSHVREASKTR